MKKILVAVSFLLCLLQGELNAQLSYPVHENNHGTGELKRVKLTTGIELEYMEKGNANGIPVILLHGFTDSWHSFEEVMDKLPEDIHVFALSQRGHGDSDKPGTGYHMHDFSEDVAAFMNKLQIKPVIIVGHSMGGLVAMRFTIDHPELTRALVIIDSDPAFGVNDGMEEFYQNVAAMTDPIDPAFVEEFQKSTITQPVSAGFYKTIVAESMKVPLRVWKQTLAALIKVNYLGELDKINVPALVLWGDRDAYLSRESQQKLVAGLSNGSLVVYEKIGHALHWEAPDRFVKDVLSFINVVETIQ